MPTYEMLFALFLHRLARLGSMQECEKNQSSCSVTAIERWRHGELSEAPSTA